MLSFRDRKVPRYRASLIGRSNRLRLIDKPASVKPSLTLLEPPYPDAGGWLRDRVMLFPETDENITQETLKIISTDWDAGIEGIVHPSPDTGRHNNC
jgi:hypothetical protein